MTTIAPALPLPAQEERSLFGFSLFKPKARPAIADQHQMVELLRSHPQGVSLAYDWMKDNWRGLAFKAMRVGAEHLAKADFEKVSQLDREDKFKEAISEFIIQVSDGAYRGDALPSTYFFDICKFKVSGLCRTKRWRCVDSLDGLGMDRSQGFARSAATPDPFEEEIFRDSLVEIGEPCRSLLQMRFADGLLLVEIAEHWDWTLHKIKKKSASCKALLFKILEKNGIDIED